MLLVLFYSVLGAFQGLLSLRSCKAYKSPIRLFQKNDPQKLPRQAPSRLESAKLQG